LTDPIRVTVWGEYRHEKSNEVVRGLYPDGMHGAIAQGIERLLGDRVAVRTATLDEPEHGLTQDVLQQTDVLTWWGHLAHADVADDVVSRVRDRVLAGMGLIVFHSAHVSKPFLSLMGSTCALHWREADDREVVWTVNPSHPIAEGVPEAFVIPRHEMYGEYFDIPAPDELIFISSFTGGEVFRSGCCFTRGLGRIFYFSPGHETYPVYHQPEVQRVIANAVKWAAPSIPIADRPFTSLNAPTGWFESER
jgi:trehalose utilization protein